MNDHEARRRLAAARVGRLATVTASGTPHLVPVVFALVDDYVYTAVDGKPKTTVALKRLANIEANGRASLLVDEYTDDWSGLWWVRADGSAQVLAADNEPRRTHPGAGPPGQETAAQVDAAIEALTRKYPQYVSQPPSGTVIAMRVTRWRWWEATAST
jgi:PPOX class probable F420-dependent enzyme